MKTNITMQQAREWYRTGNNDGRGYAPSDVTGDEADTIDMAVARMTGDGWTLLLSRDTSDDVALLRNDTSDGALVAIGGDAAGRNPWVIDVTRYAAK